MATRDSGLNPSTPVEGEPTGRTMAASKRWLSTEPRLFLAVFALIAGLLLFGSGRSFIRADGFESGDPAVNAIAIHDAGEWRQIHGNYSRWGFFHPGPVFFYWEAAWEWLLCDLTGIADAPMGAHFIAIVTLNSALLALTITLLSRQFRSPAFVPLACVAAVIQFALVNRGVPHAALLSIWPPHLLLVPFMLFVVSCGALAGGAINVLPIAVFAGGLLAHGHAAQGMFILPIFLVAVAMWLWNARTAPWKVDGGRTAVVVASIVLAVFLIPLVLDAAQGTGSNLLVIWQQLNAPTLKTPRSWFKAFLYLFSFFGYITNQADILLVMSDKTEDAFRSSAPALAFWALVHLVLIAIWILKRRDNHARTIRATIAMLFLALALSVVWGKVQTGAPENFNAFYVHGLALLAAWLLAGIAIKRLPRSAWIPGAAWAVLLVSVFVFRSTLTRSLGSAPKERETIGNIARGYAGRPGPVMISFPNDDWGEAATIALAMVRAGVDARVGEEWQFMFGRRHTLAAGKDPREVVFVQRAEVTGTVGKFRQSYGIRRDVPLLACGKNLIGPDGIWMQPFVVSGIQFDRASAEAQGQAISVSHSARMRFRLPMEARAVNVTLFIRSQDSPATNTGQRAIVSWDGQQVADVFVDGSSTVAFPVTLPEAGGTTTVDLRIDSPDAWQPRELGTSADFRRFGLYFDSIEIEVGCAGSDEK